MNIVHIFDDSFTANVLADRLFAMSRAGIDSHVLCGSGPDTRRLETAGIPVTPVRLSGDINAYRLTRASFEIGSFLKQHSVDVVHTHGWASGVAGGLAARNASVPSVHTFDGCGTRSRWTGIGRTLRLLGERMSGKLATLLVTRTQHDLSEAQTLGIGEIGRRSCVGDGVDLERFRPGRLPRNTGEVTVVSVARLDPGQDHGTLFRALRILKRRGERLRVYLIGDGPRRVAYRKACLEWGLEDRVALLGHRDDVPSLLREADIFVDLSVGRPLPRALMEAMASGVAVVARRGPVVDAMLRQHESAMLVNPGNADQLAAALSLLLEQPETRWRLGEQARVAAAEHFDERKVVQSLRSLYLSITESSGFRPVLKVPSAIR
jgi:glycosyltransferase involved in cell wall biosynthesis